MNMERRVRKETAAWLVTQQDFKDPLGHRDPQERQVSQDSQEPRASEACRAEMVSRECRGRKVHLGSWANPEPRESLARYFSIRDSKVTKEIQVFQDSPACQGEQGPPEETATQDFLAPKAPRVP